MLDSNVYGLAASMRKTSWVKDDVCAQTAMNIPIYLCPMILQKETLYNTKQNNAIR